MRPLVSIAGHPIPGPSTYNSTTSTVVDSGRNAEAKWIGSVIREDMAKIEMDWKFITAEDWSNIVKLFSEKYGGSFVNSVTFYCQDTNSWETRDMYVPTARVLFFYGGMTGAFAGISTQGLH